MKNKAIHKDSFVSDDVEIVFKQHREIKKNENFKRSKFRVFVFAILTGFIMISMLYFFHDASKVKGYAVEGNYLLSDKEILNTLELSQNTHSIFVNDILLNQKIKSDALIESVDTTVNAQGIVTVNVTEKKMIGYRYQDIPELISGTGEIFEMSDRYAHLISRLPLIVGFDAALSEEQIQNNELSLIEQLAKAMNEIDPIRIEMISEIHQYAYSYDENGVLCIMQDGNEIYGSLYSMEMLNSYTQVASALPNKKNCIYIDEMSGNPYVSLCPEEKALQEAELAEENGEKSPE